MDKQTYQVTGVGAVRHGGRLYYKGDRLDFTRLAAEQLLSLRAIEKVEAEQAAEKTSKPEGAELTTAIREAVALLGDDPEARTQDGKPKVDKVSELLGYEVSRAEITLAEEAA